MPVDFVSLGTVVIGVTSIWAKLAYDSRKKGNSKDNHEKRIVRNESDIAFINQEMIYLTESVTEQKLENKEAHADMNKKLDRLLNK